jgi:polysaccharide biosynthesis/export protein
MRWGIKRFASLEGGRPRGPSLAFRIVAAAMLALLTGCLFADPPALPVAPQLKVLKSAERYQKEYVLSPGDQVAVSVFHVPAASQKAIVRPDGYISLPLVKEVKAAGLTVPQLDAKLTTRFSEQLVNPDVSVAVDNPREAAVFVVGEVTKPGPVPIRDAPTVAEAVARSGGVPHTADLDNVAVIRLQDDGYITATVVERANSGQAAFYTALSTMLLQPEDIVIVPESGRSQFVRFIQDYINTPLTGVNSIISPYLNFKILSRI